MVERKNFFCANSKENNKSFKKRIKVKKMDTSKVRKIGFKNSAVMVFFAITAVVVFCATVPAFAISGDTPYLPVRLAEGQSGYRQYNPVIHDYMVFREEDRSPGEPSYIYECGADDFAAPYLVAEGGNSPATYGGQVAFEYSVEIRSTLVRDGCEEPLCIGGGHSQGSVVNPGIFQDIVAYQDNYGSTYNPIHEDPELDVDNNYNSKWGSLRGSYFE